MKSEATPLATVAATTGSPIRLLPLVPAAASALFALQSHADAAIIYSGTQDLTVSFAGNLGGQEKALGLSVTNANINATRYGGPGNYLGLAQFRMAGGGKLIFNASGDIKKLASGALISAGKVANGTGTIVGFHNGARINGTWPSAQVGFAGFETKSGDFGWVRLEWTNTDSNADPNTLTAIDWAYNSTPGQSITAGQGAVPEPGTTALLALAGAGAAFLGRKRAA